LIPNALGFPTTELRFFFLNIQQLMNPSADGSITCFFSQLCVGDPTGAEQLWQRYSPRLLGLARKTLGHREHAGFDADDVAQSAFISFWQRASDGQFARDIDRNDLWNLLGVITVRKAQKKMRDGLAQKRGGGKVITEAAMPGDSEGHFQLDGQLGGLPTAELDLTCEELLSKLDDEPRSIVLLKLMGYTNREIADLLECTERKVERKLQLIRRIWQELEASG